MEIKYQQKINNSICISKNRINIYPMVMDYSNIYKHNQYDVIGLIDAEIQVDGDIKYISDPAITNSNISITTKVDSWGNPLFYQYQLKYDCKYPDNIQVYDKDGKLIPFVLEYGSVESEHILLSHNTEKLYDPLDNYTMYGQIVTTPVYNSISVYGELPFTIYGGCFSSGEIYYSNDTISSLDANVFSIYFLYKEVDDDYNEQFIFNERGTINIVNSGGSKSLNFNIDGNIDSCSITYGRWYRLDYYYNNITDTSSAIIYDLTSPSSPVDTLSFSASLFNTSSDLHMKITYNACFDVGFFKDSLPDSDMPLYVHRYSKSITWNESVPDSDSYRIRLLFQSNMPAIIHYDGIDSDGNLLQNRREEINYQLVYKKYYNATVNDWTWSENKVLCTSTLYDEISEGDVVYVYPDISNQVRVFYDSVDKKIHVSNGEFLSDDYDGLNNLYYYNIPEYENVAFATDGQNKFKPYYIKVVRERVNLISPYTIQLGQFFIYEGSYPDYVIPNTYEIYRYYDNNGNLQKLVTDVESNYITSRGINIYKNGTLLSNSDIVNYNMYNGTITMRNKFNADDKVEVTYLRSAPDFILTYPIIDPLISEDDGGVGSNLAFRLYLRPNYPNYEIENPNDTQVDRLCYKFLVDGEPTGDYRSCFSNLTFNPTIITKHEDYIIPIADVSIIMDRSFEDIRERGGGILETKVDSYSKSPAFLDVGYGVNGKMLPQSIVFIKIPNSILTYLTETYYNNDEDSAIIYIKESIERYISSGVFYILIDEDNNLWKKPYPLGIKI
jgi:hypothetical protein